MNRRYWLVTVVGTIGTLAILGNSSFTAAGNSKGGAGVDPASEMGILTGKVTAPKEFKAAQVYAKNTDKKVVYMVYTSGGSYRASNLMPGNYEVSVKKNGFASDVQKVSIGPGVAAEANFMLREAPNVPRRGVYPLFRIPLETPAVSYDELYPPAPARALIEKTCMFCHGPNFVPSHQWDAKMWNWALDQMMGTSGMIQGRIVPGTFTSAEREDLVNYLTTNYGPKSVVRSLATPEMPLDEEALSKAMYVEYEVPAAYGGPMHDAHFDNHGKVWLAERTDGRPNIAELDPATAAWKDFPIPDPILLPHGVTSDDDGHVWFSGDVALGQMETATGEMALYHFGTQATVRQSHGHTLVLDSKKNVWFTLSYSNELGRWDHDTKTLKMYKSPTAFSFPYGLAVDQNDKLWMAEWNRCKVAKFDPDDGQFIEYTPLTRPCSMRRVTVDHKGTVWYALDGGGKIGKINPNTGKIVEYTIPTKYSTPYDIQADADDMMWISDAGQGGALIKFDPQTEKFTYYPSLQFTDMPKLQMTRDGNIWYSARSAETPAVGVLYPDVTKMTSLVPH